MLPQFHSVSSFSLDDLSVFFPSLTAHEPDELKREQHTFYRRVKKNVYLANIYTWDMVAYLFLISSVASGL
jgi:hypothetical protein